ncbi:HAD family hydrolase [Erythrobacter arachoides]|uniref:HAD family hydrolase n=1 Tax=Aurantiacibacter arachoides TaxID=1850444 RepID=A0A845A152_9SPHN|nr:HAD family hydrolase [Aurantiacibacter arachoides]MXO93202.1 HAD family hydrolase [Aurantiacibacter arachoides]GGD51223.1 branched chain amino acid aminotransferase [Aurantiacibacter arachoides]
MWSGPRNISSAMMRSFGARQDCAVSDEPFYGAFLAASKAPHPLAAQVIADMDCDWRSVLATLSGAAPGGKPVWYQKHMPHHMVGSVTIADMPHHRHAFLIRDPARMVASYSQKNEIVGPEALGYAQMRRYFELESERAGCAAPVVDADTILADPRATLERLCLALGIGWEPAMLSWASGARDTDGVWGSHWYDKVNASTGFGPRPAITPTLTTEYAAVAQACRADYEALRRFAI